MNYQAKTILWIRLLAIAFLITPLLSKSQIYYSVPPLVNYFTFYKNGKSIGVLNDTIRTSFFKLSDSTFLIKFYTNGKLQKQCSCFYRGNEKKEKANILQLKNGKRTLVKKEITVRELVLKDETCLDFLPKKLLKGDN
ncbi:MAG: hypothetical protein BGO29_11585 [Bacteroidales bacterium 36-12]|nr:MAG: hypothetical protein BGO29_11585 [Bacteroidales bacterium 36-12]